MLTKDARATKASSIAPWCTVPDVDIVSVEHPGVIKNIDSAILSLGGDQKITSFLEAESSNRVIGLYLRPEDHFRRPVSSHVVRTANVALRVTVPQRTGRKRKRGSSEPFFHDKNKQPLSSRVGDRRMLQSLRDNPQTSHIEAIGFVQETHRFRDAPDFQYSIASSPLVQSLRENVLTFDYESLKDFKLDTKTRGVQPHMDMIPPPVFSTKRIHFNYAYHQNPSVKLTHDETGEAIAINTSIVPRTSNQLVTFDVEVIPQTASTNLAPEGTLAPRMQLLIKRLREVFEERPISTRRVVFNKLPRDRAVIGRKIFKHQTVVRDNEYDLKCALRYVCYMFRSGPWKNALIKLGVDPRTDVKYRVYQTMSFQIESRDRKRLWEDHRLKWQRGNKDSELDKESHLFDGKKITLDGKIWQACDIIDPMLRKILDDDTLRDACDIQQDGWYNNGAWAKLRAIMRDKIQVIMAGGTPDDLDYIRIAHFPNILDNSNIDQALITTHVTPKELLLASQVRNLAKSVEAQNKRYGLLGTESHKNNNTETVNDENFNNDGGEEQVTLDDATAMTDDEESDDKDDDDDEDDDGSDRASDENRSNDHDREVNEDGGGMIMDDYEI